MKAIAFNKLPYIKFKNNYSYDYGVYITKLPEIIRPEKRITEFTIPGRSGKLFFDENSFENYTKTAEAALMSLSRLDEIMSWLTGYGPVIFSNERDKYYEAVIKNQVIMSKFAGEFKTFPIQFDCHPFKYSVNEENEGITLTSPESAFHGRGTWPAAPIVTVYASGNVTISINGKQITLTDVLGSITLDSETENAHLEGVSQNSKMTGEFPELSPEENRISYFGNVTKIEIAPRWRWL